MKAKTFLKGKKTILFFFLIINTISNYSSIAEYEMSLSYQFGLTFIIKKKMQAQEETHRSHVNTLVKKRP